MSASTDHPNKRPTAKANKKTTKRGPGRPTGITSGMLNRETILEVAFKLTKTVSLTDLSIVLVARELGVTPALIHYYLGGGGRDGLTSAVMNMFYHELVDQWPIQPSDPPTGFDEWQHSIEIIADAIYRAHLRYPGVSVYVSSNNRYQLVQDVGEGETDYGLLFIEKFTSAVRQSGFDAERVGIFAHLLLMSITNYAHSTVTRRWPGQHGEFLNSKLAELDPEIYPSTLFVRETLTNLNGAQAFSTGLRLTLQGIQVEHERLFGATPSSSSAPPLTNPPAPKRRAALQR